MLDSAYSMAADLARLARETSSPKRVELLRRITQAILEQPHEPSAAERYLLDEIIESLIEKIAGRDRVEVATIISALPRVPETVEWTLASDGDIEVARPILRDYRGASEDTLVEVASAGSQDHLVAIASRFVVTPRVTDIVVERGSQETVRVLAANHGAQFSQRGMHTLIGRSEQDVNLQALIVERSDLSLEAIGKLLPIISQELALRLQATMGELNAAMVGDHLVGWMEDRQHNIGTTDGLVEAVRGGAREVNAVAMELIEDKRLFDLATVLAAIIDLDRFHTFNVLTRGAPQGALLMMKSIGLHWPVVDAFFKLRRIKMPSTDNDERIERRHYEAIDMAAARRVIRFMKVRRAALAMGETVAAG